ncbi:peptidoglycan/xylan/chitin deacetylase (PgdA/CDA1 family) [Herbaspirillum sp. Sphag1AN]|uniref:polysaccharide deacetylase family protein n=1 Tax=unclassified Herbaspirillum TaxID=2624150 RepID=UPI001621D4FA|nr:MULTISPECIES: polysaccharide deacetylase family protein [unclassified Herbaspirillum]MBB3211095.1 peptidoglycan/xylan/chitin deacetylase (PgdA/CDA1 family) [Herbaspirillum sp. Sphag1AN]MBB3244724.1 peptidoglycan/xylan/chitin deacetylase (PgdA/CDA1 family) [Herbaspirillum sp. Sphag64]
MTESVSRLSLRISRRLSQHAFKQNLRLQGSNGVVCFTFDDAPASACQTGARILEQAGARGTFYIAGGLTGHSEQGKPCHTEADLRRLLTAGHELGCHSFSHVRCDTLTAKALQDELDKNAAFLAQLGVDTRRLNFAYPFGAYAYQAKRIGRARFRSSRVTGGGLESGQVDLNALKTHRLYNVPVDTDSVETLISRAAQEQGWLIINTHDVEDTPSRYGISPARLEQVVAAALAAGCKLMTMNAAIDYWQQQEDAGTD